MSGSLAHLHLRVHGLDDWTEDFPPSNIATRRGCPVFRSRPQDFFPAAPQLSSQTTISIRPPMSVLYLKEVPVHTKFLLKETVSSLIPTPRTL
jgi:hypothetical protein